MERISDLLNRIFEKALVYVAQLGLPLAITAWFSVFFTCIAMAFVLKRYSLRGRLRAPIIVAILSLAAHLADYFVTLKMSPDLSLEVNPIWVIVLEKMGLTIAKWYGLTGKIMLAVLSFEFFALYLIKRETLFPENATGFISFCKNLGRRGNKTKLVRLSNLTVLFLYLFALMNPICFYIAFLNSLVDKPLFDEMPSVPIVLICYLLVLTAAYFIDNYRVFINRGSLVPPKTRLP
jgi:hypothetical protein